MCSTSRTSTVPQLALLTWASTSISTGENPLPSLSYVFNLCLFTLSFLIKNKKEHQPISSPSSSLFHNQTSQNGAHSHHIHCFICCTTLHLLFCGCCLTTPPKREAQWSLAMLLNPNVSFRLHFTSPVSCGQSLSHILHAPALTLHILITEAAFSFSKSRFHTCCPPLLLNW